MSRHLRLTRLGRRDQYGCELLSLALIDSARPRVLESVDVVSGAPGRQHFRTRADEVAGRDEPIPEGSYSPLGPVEWAGRPGDYAASWSSALGPVWIDLHPRRAIGLHLDANRSYAPGSAGCVCPLTMADLRKVVAWWDGGRPEQLVVDWGLGSVPPVGRSDPSRLKFFAHSGRAKCLRDGKEEPALAMRLDYHSGRVGLAVNGVQLPTDQILSISIDVATARK